MRVTGIVRGKDYYVLINVTKAHGFCRLGLELDEVDAVSETACGGVRHLNLTVFHLAVLPPSIRQCLRGGPAPVAPDGFTTATAAHASL